MCEQGQAWSVARARIVLNTVLEWTGAKSDGFSVMQMRPVYRHKVREASGGHIPCGKHRAPRLPRGRSVSA